ncbi:YdcF family protein [Oceanobacillus damuensis]|uniref:YdcF family protein n=1 Tax=Oceanobacillus damuensis TaxID=937928 RepID=UPI000A922A39|nr:YdcF family protein [Oceanobacillus damuensis]
MKINISQLDPEKLSDLQMTELLFYNMEDDHKKGDCIFVPGSSKAVIYRLPKAVELYKAGRAKKILFSGGVTWEGTDLPEAELLRSKAIELGVSDQDILVEQVSLHTKENVLASLLILDRALGLHNIRRLIVVTTNIHMHRMYLCLKTFMPSWISYSLCMVDDVTIKKDNWFNHADGRKRVKMETWKLINYVKLGYIMDEEVEISE